MSPALTPTLGKVTSMPTQSKISAVILAAGSSRRMGLPKLLLPWGNTTVIGQVTGVVCAAGVFDPVLVTGRSEQAVRAATAAFGVRWVHNPAYAHTEMLQSLQIGLREISRLASACLIVLGDQPQIEGTLVDEILAAYRTELPSTGCDTPRVRRSGEALPSEKWLPHRILIPSYQQRRGHPWLVQRDLWDELLELPEDANLRIFLNRHAGEIEYLNVTTPTVLMDLDTPEDYARSKPTLNRVQHPKGAPKRRGATLGKVSSTDPETGNT